jgi:hypothetical protein
VGDRNLGGPAREALGERRNERRGLVAAVDLLDDVARVRPQHAAEIRQLHPRDHGRDAVDGSRGQAAEQRVLSPLPHAANHVVALGELVQELRDLLGRILQVGVEGDHHVSVHVLEGRQESLVLSEVARELEHADAIRPRARRLLENLERAIPASVVHEDQLVGRSPAVHHGEQAREQLGQAALLVVDGDDDGDLHGRATPVPERREIDRITGRPRS